MPAELSAEAIEALQRHLAPKLYERACWVCLEKNWIIMDSVFETREFIGRGFSTAGQVMPLVIVTCQTCGLIVPFNAIHVGAVKIDTKSP